MLRINLCFGGEGDIARTGIESARRITRCASSRPGRAAPHPPTPLPPSSEASEATSFAQPQVRTLAWGSFCGGHLPEFAYQQNSHGRCPLSGLEIDGWFRVTQNMKYRASGIGLTPA